MSTTPDGLVRDLREIGAPIVDLWELVNTKAEYKVAIPVLIDWLQNVDARVPDLNRRRVREGLVRALSIPAARPAAAPALIQEFQNLTSASDPELGWVIGNALSVVADDTLFDEVAVLVRDRHYGKARQMVVLSLGRSRDPRAVPLLLHLLDDDDVIAHAVMALGRLKPPGVRQAIERLSDHPDPLVRRAVRKNLAKVNV